MRWLLGVIVLSVSAILAASPHQFPQSPPTFRSNVELVRVDVVVVDQDGNPVRGLKQDAFTLLDRGNPQTIATFDEIAPVATQPVVDPVIRSVPLDVASNQSPQSDRLIVLVLDDLHIWKGRTARAKQIAHDVIAQLGGESSMAVMFTSQEHNTQVTADQALLSAAVDTLTGRQSWRRPHQAIDVQRPPRIDPEMSMDRALAAISDSQDVRLQDFFDNMTLYKTLSNAAKVLGSSGARRKAFVLVSEGMGKDLGAILSGPVSLTRLNLGPPPLHAMAVLESMESLRRSNVATYAIDPRGAVGVADLKRECFPPPRLPDLECSDGLTDAGSLVRRAERSLSQLSEASGGFAVTNTNDFTGGLQKIVGDLDHYYLLGFYPADPTGKDYRRLDVRVGGHADWTLRFRHGYLPGALPVTPKNASPLAALSAGVMPATDLALRLNAIALPGRARNPHVDYSVEVSAPRAALEEPDGRVRDTLKYELLVVDEKKTKVTSVHGFDAQLTLSPHPGRGTRPATLVYQIDDGIDLAPGRYQFRLSAASAKVAKGGSVYLDVDVPNFSDVVALGGIALGYANGPHVPLATPLTDRADVARGAPGEAETRHGTLPFAPTLDRQFTRADTLRVYIPGSLRRSDSSAILSVDIVGAGKRSVTTIRVPFANGHAETMVPLQALDPGPYVLRATLSDGVDTASHEISITIK